MNILTLFISAMLINNIILTKFIGLCPFIGVSTKMDSAVGMGLAVIFVTCCASMISWVLYYTVLVNLGLEYMKLICFILLIAAFVQFVELFVKKNSPALYKSLGIYLPLITTNCAVLYVALDNISQEYTILQALINSLGASAGFMLMLCIFSTIRERLRGNDVPESFQGNPIAFIIAGIMAIAFSSLAGLV